MDAYSSPYRTQQTFMDTIVGALKLVTLIGTALIAAYLVTSSLQAQVPSLPSAQELLPLEGNTIISVPLKYTVFPDVGRVATPHIDATLIGKTKEVPVQFLLDSGAKISALPMRFADEVGLDKETAKRIYLRSATDNTTYGYISDIDIRLNHTTINIPITFAEVIEPLLGTFGFFDKYTIIFQNGDKVIIKPKG